MSKDGGVRTIDELVDTPDPAWPELQAELTAARSPSTCWTSTMRLTVFDPVHAVIASFQGYGLDHLSLSIIDTVDALEISLLPIHPLRLGQPGASAGWGVRSSRDRFVIC